MPLHSRSPFRRTPLAALAIAGLVAFSAAGCKTQTSRQLAAEEEERQRHIQIAREQRERKEAAENLSEEEKRLREEVERFNRKQEREKQLQRARAALGASSGAPEATRVAGARRALEIIDKIFNPTWVIQTQASGARVLAPPYDPEADIDTAERASILELRALAQHDAGDVEKAIADYARVVEIEPDRRSARRNLGKLLYKEKRYEEALKYFLMELEDGYWPVEILFFVGRCHYEIGRETKDRARYEAAILAIEATVVADPDDVEKLRWLSYLNYEIERYEEAIRLMEAIRSKNPLDPEYLRLLANAYSEIEQPQKAIEYYELVAQIDGPKKQLCLSIGELYAGQEHLARAAEWFSRAYDDEPSRAPIDERLYVGQLHAETGHTGRAIEWLSAVPRQNDRGEDVGDAYFNARAILASVYLEARQFEKALEAFAQMREARPLDCVAYLAAGDIYLDQKRLDEAQKVFSRAAALPDCRGGGLAGLAEVAYARGNLTVAIREYENALEASPDSPGYKTALEQIRTELRIQQEREAVADAEKRSQ